MLEKSASPRHSCTSPACLAPQNTSLLSPCIAQAAPSLSEQTATKYLPGLVPCPMDDKCDRSIKKNHSITASRLWSKLSYRHRQGRAEPPSRRMVGGGVRRLGGLQPLGSPPARRRRYTALHPCQIPKSNDLC